MTARLTPQAQADLDAIAGHIRRDIPEAAERFVRGVRARIGLLSDMPLAGPRLAGDGVRRFLVHGR